MLSKTGNQRVSSEAPALLRFAHCCRRGAARTFSFELSCGTGQAAASADTPLPAAFGALTGFPLRFSAPSFCLLEYADLEPINLQATLSPSALPTLPVCKCKEIKRVVQYRVFLKTFCGGRTGSNPNSCLFSRHTLRKGRPPA